MSESERVRRPQPQRTEPDRSWQQAFQDGDSATEDAVAQGVQSGYRVMREQLALGQQLAERFAPELAGLWSGSLGGSEEALARWFETWSQIATLGAGWMERPGNGRAHGNLSERDIGVYDVSAPRPFAITLQLDAPNEDETGWTVHPLFAADAALAPVSDVALALDDGTLRLRAHLSEDATAERYSGVVTERTTNEPRGMLSITLLD